MKRNLSLALAGIVACFLFSCKMDIGLGNEVDLVAPTLTVESPANNSFVPKTFSISGTATDNIEVERVVFNYNYKYNGEKLTGVSECPAYGGRYSCSFSFDKDIEVNFEITAMDKNGNGSEYSSASKTYIVDSKNPKIGSVAIKRNGFIARFLRYEEFSGPLGKTEKQNYPENKDYFQNQSFTIFSSLKDEYGIGRTTIRLYDEGGSLVVEKEPDDLNNKFAPEFTITHMDITASRPSYASGLHYLRAELNARDAAGNEVVEDKGWLAWYPDYDEPHVIYSTMVNNEIKVPKGSGIPVTVFDDDGLGSISYQIVPAAGYTTSTVIDSLPAAAWRTPEYCSPSDLSNLRDKTFEIKAKDAGGTEYGDGAYFLVTKVVDTSTESPDTYKTYCKAVNLYITDGEAATIIIRSPEENSVPSLTKSGTDYKFTISGYTIDNAAVSNIAVAWLPEGDSQISAAEAFFAGYDFAADREESGIKCMKLTSTSLPVGVSVPSGKTGNGFSKEFDFFEDFKIGGNTVNDRKVFVFACKDLTGNITTKVFRLNKITAKPSFKIYYSINENAAFPGSWTETSSPLITISPVVTYFRIVPSAEYSLPIESCTVECKEGAVDKPGFTGKTPWDSSTGYASFKLTDNLGTGNPKSGASYTVSLNAEDKLANTQLQKLTVSFDQIGSLQSITVSCASGKTFKKGEKIRLQANYDYPVSFTMVDEKPYIQLDAVTPFKKKDGAAVDPSDRRAEYVSGSGSNTLYFEYEIKDEIECKKLKIPSSNPIIIPDGVTVTGNLNNSTWTNSIDTKNINVDAIAPYVTSYSPAVNGIKNKESDDSFVIELNFNEKINIESGKLVLQRTANWYIPPYLENDVFLNLYRKIDSLKDASGNNLSDAVKNQYKVALCGSSTNVFKYGTDVLNDEYSDSVGTIIPEGPYMQYTNGLVLTDGGNATPDSKTKYVLAYDLNIADTTAGSKVQKIRDVLEKLDYHRAEYEINSASVELANGNKTLRLTVKKSDFEGGLRNGVEYYLTLSAGSIYDDAFNYIEESEMSKSDASNSEELALAVNEYKFWVGPVATPVIRVNRKATNRDNKKPTAKTSYKIDCETQGATIKYGVNTLTITGVTSETNNDVKHTAPADITTANLKALSVSTILTNNSQGTTSGAADIGDGNLDTAQKIYIKATAEKTGFDSSDGYEGAYKTVLHYYFDSKTLSRVHGSQAPEGTSSIAGFPMQLNNSDRKTYQVPWKNNNDYYWVSWQIVSDFTLQTYSSNFQNPADPACSYGQYIYCKNITTY